MCVHEENHDTKMLILRLALCREKEKKIVREEEKFPFVRAAFSTITEKSF